MTLDIYFWSKTSLSTAEIKVYQNCKNVTLGIFAHVYYTVVFGVFGGDVNVLLSWWYLKWW